MWPRRGMWPWKEKIQTLEQEQKLMFMDTGGLDEKKKNIHCVGDERSMRGYMGVGMVPLVAAWVPWVPWEAS